MRRMPGVSPTRAPTSGASTAKRCLPGVAPFVAADEKVLELRVCRGLHRIGDFCAAGGTADFQTSQMRMPVSVTSCTQVQLFQGCELADAQVVVMDFGAFQRRTTTSPRLDTLQDRCSATRVLSSVLPTTTASPTQHNRNTPRRLSTTRRLKRGSRHRGVESAYHFGWT